MRKPRHKLSHNTARHGGPVKRGATLVFSMLAFYLLVFVTLRARAVPDAPERLAAGEAGA